MDSEFPTAVMSVNDRCRLCDRNLRTDGIIGNSILIFDHKDKYGCIYDQLSKLGLDLINTPLRSPRICRQCFTVIASLQRDKQIIDEWRKQEILETCQESCVSSTDDHTPSDTTETKSTDLTLPSRSSGTEKPSGFPDCNMSFRKAVLLQRHQQLHTDQGSAVPSEEHGIVDSIRSPFVCTDCGKGFRYQAALSRHERLHSGESLYQCPQCDRSFTLHAFLRNHLKTHARQTAEEQGMRQPKSKPYECPDCNKSFRFAALLQRHQRLHTGENVFRCPQCNKIFTLAAQLERHLRIHSRTRKSFKCTQCEKPLPSRHDLRMHQNKLNDVKPTQCPHCDKVLSRTTCISYHRGKHLEGSQRYECSQCGKQFSGATKLKDHQRIHGEKPYTCSLCGAAYIRPSSLARHQLKHTGETPFKCCQCSCAFRCKSSLKHHKRTHDDDVGGQLCRCAQCEKIFTPPTWLTSLEKRRHKCPHCGKAFERLTYFRFHLLTHTKGGPFGCGQCLMEFSSNILLKMHQKTHQRSHQKVTRVHQKVTSSAAVRSSGPGRKCSYCCCQCNRVFEYKRRLRAHRKEAHPEAKLCACTLCRNIFLPHECVDCGKSFSSLSALQAHRRSHTGEKPYECKWCQKTFGFAVSLRDHVRTHTGEKPFLCSACGDTFANRQGLIQHEGIHAAERPYPCPSCGRAFASAKDMSGHQCHPEGTQDDGAGRSLTGPSSGEEEGMKRPRPRPHECPDCNKSFRYAALLQRHQRLHTGVNVFRCPQCNRPFTLLTELEMHLRTHTQSHTPKPFKCSRCEKPFTRLRDLWTHQNKPKDDKPTQCPHCDKVFSHTMCIKYDRGKHREATPCVCSKCGKGFSSATSFQDHQRLHKPYRCSPCDSAFLQPSPQITFTPPTRLTSLQKRRHKCLHCGKAFVHLMHLRLHLRMHAREKPFQCGQCERPFSYDSQLEVHKRSHVHRKAAAGSLLEVYPKVAHDDGDKYQCCRCERTFRQKRALRTHRNESHADAEPCGCAQCSKIRPHECSECGKCFSVLSALRSHQKLHSEERAYVCSQCGKSFAQPAGLRHHKRRHSEEKPFPCSDCGKAFKVPGELRRHRRSHTGERPYACMQCGKTFAVAGALRSHQQVHSGEKPFICSICGQAFLRRQSLNRHAYVHTGVKPYPCLRCGRAFTRPAGLATHRCSAERRRKGTGTGTDITHS